ncbi:uncharacterized protein KIAA0513-like [Ornithodoros turicata]|uniref:uncharacterized protein KIAA0513-like n=1 Tax=Ornithodoros turicata TaxID=34597 RepID=UPI00313A3FCD
MTRSTAYTMISDGSTRTQGPAGKPHIFSSLFAMKADVEPQTDNAQAIKTGSRDSEDAGNHPPGLLTSVLGNNCRIITDLSSKLEAALSFSFDSTEDAITGEPSNSSKSELSPGKQHLLQLHLGTSECSVTEKVQQWKESSRVAKRTFGSCRDRSVYGQPQISAGGSPKLVAGRRDASHESLETLDDSGHNSSACSVEQDAVSSVFLKDSVGIGSESDTCGPSTSVDSSDTESPVHGALLRTASDDGSLHSLTSSFSGDSQRDEATEWMAKFMKSFVGRIFEDHNTISFEEKAYFGELCRHEDGRLWFSRYVNIQRVHSKRVSESTFYSLVQHFAIVLFECVEADDFTPAKTLMNMCFTFYHEVMRNGCLRKEYLYMYLKEQPIWKSLRFWNAAFFDALQSERTHRPLPTRSDISNYSPEDIQDEQTFQGNLTFGQLGTFTHNMHAFGLSKEFCYEFLRKQCAIANLPQEHVAALKGHIEWLYRASKPTSQ